ncbi:MAG: RNA methyltransferase [Christensenellaceae bacterium]|jgi:TrmH family RNA methyltransferase|nr:RNA methyltransferase [Christensenellaceae bacterium]
MLIESTRNEAVKRARALANRKGRAEQGLHFIEGEKLVREAIVSGAVFADAFVEEGHDLMCAVLAGSGAHVYTVKRAVMESLTLTDTPQWVCAMVQTPSAALPNYYPAGLIVALDCVQDPGNLGAILRTADAMGAVGMLLGAGCADPYAPKPLRAAMGSIYHLPVWQASLTTELARLQEQGFKLICGHLKGGEALPAPTNKCVLVIGSEGSGVSEEVAALCETYRLPMYGFAESLNASVAAGILIYELAREMHK